MTLDDLARQAQFTAEGLLECAVTAMRERIGGRGKLSAAKIDAEQHGAHGLAWLATYVEAIKEMAAYSLAIVPSADTETRTLTGSCASRRNRARSWTVCSRRARRSPSSRR